MVWTAGLWGYLQTPPPSWRYFVASALCFSHLPAWTMLMIPCSYVCMIRFFYCYGRALSLKFSLAGDVLDCNFNSLTPILFFPVELTLFTNLLEFSIQLLTSVTEHITSHPSPNVQSPITTQLPIILSTKMCFGEKFCLLDKQHLLWICFLIFKTADIYNWAHIQMGYQ